MPANITYCDIKHVRVTFAAYYPYISIIICIFGSVTNILNICVLTTKAMRCPTNMILTAFAFANLLLMLEYIPFVVLYTGDKSYASFFTYSLAVIVLIHAFYSHTFHFVSACLTVVLATWQYIAVKFPQHNNKWCNVRRTEIAIFLTFVLCAIVCLPLLLLLTIIERPIPVDKLGKINKTYPVQNFTIYLTDYKYDEHRYFSSYLYALVLKLSPCILLAVLSALLIVELLRAKKRRKQLMNVKVGENQKLRKPSARFLEKEKQTDRTTRMLLLVLSLFLLGEFPQAIFGLLIAVKGEVFQTECYAPLGDIFDVAVLTTFAINFILYCIMSKKFRSVFKESFFQYLPCFSKTKDSLLTLNTLNTYV